MNANRKIHQSGPLISVVMPSYNHGRYLARALRSVVNQNYPYWELFVIDNHSTDDTDEVLNRFAEPRITVLKIRNNGIIAASRNMGIRAARGEWIAFLDSDDWWAAKKLEVCLSEIDEEVDVIYHPLKIVNEKPRLFGRRSIKSWQVKAPVTIDLLVRGNAIATSSAMVRTSLLVQVNGMNECPGMVAAEDYNTWLRVAQKSERFKYVRQRLGYYHLHENGTSSAKDMSAPARVAIGDYLGLLQKEQRNKLEANIRYTSGRRHYLSKNLELAMIDLRFSLRYGKVSRKPKVLFMLCTILVNKMIRALNI